MKKILTIEEYTPELLTQRKLWGNYSFDRDFDVVVDDEDPEGKPMICRKGETEQVDMAWFLEQLYRPMTSSGEYGNYEKLRPSQINSDIEEAEQMPAPRAAYGPFWTEGQIACLFADSNTGKSILAYQIAHELTQKGVPVLYFDFEMSIKQLQMRYARPDGKGSFRFADWFFRVESNPDQLEAGTTYEDKVMNEIESMADNMGIRHIIIDNITTLSSRGQDGEAAIKLMTRLRKIKSKYGMSILVIAHTPKRDKVLPLTEDDLAGSKNLYNIFDSVFGMNRTSVNSAWRYLKQTKVRTADYIHTADNVLLMNLVKREDGFLGFETIGCETEANLLPKFAEGNEKSERDAEMFEQAKELRDQGLTYEQIAQKLGTSKAKISRLFKRFSAEK